MRKIDDGLEFIVSSSHAIRLTSVTIHPESYASWELVISESRQDAAATEAAQNSWERHPAAIGKRSAMR